MTTNLAVIGNHDHLIGNVLTLGTLACVVFGYFIWALCCASGRDAPRSLPGALGDSVQGEDAYYERLRTPGMGDLSDTPIFDSVCEDVAAESHDHLRHPLARLGPRLRRHRRRRDPPRPHRRRDRGPLHALGSPAALVHVDTHIGRTSWLVFSVAFMAFMVPHILGGGS
jgi:hypothetical protein